eukprot:TRINITY_DN3486_c0_g1_i1.p1 TRINITY_DN3486_c0_g1~~TRINITY_DN3486_c0_g1_i1.p1  ORF type:complete len:691 (+),score=156.89 TRINITY_DN3486_c0_g1_i1:17-2089(+)
MLNAFLSTMGLSSKKDDAIVRADGVVYRSTNISGVSQMAAQSFDNELVVEKVGEYAYNLSIRNLDPEDEVPVYVTVPLTRHVQFKKVPNKGLGLSSGFEFLDAEGIPVFFEYLGEEEDYDVVYIVVAQACWEAELKQDSAQQSEEASVEWYEKQFPGALPQAPVASPSASVPLTSPNAPTSRVAAPEGSTLVQVNGKYLVAEFTSYNEEKDTYAYKNKGLRTISIIQGANGSYFLTIADGSDLELNVLLSDSFDPAFTSKEMNEMEWSDVNAEQSYIFRFSSPDTATQFKHVLIPSLYETKTQQKFNKLGKNDKINMLMSYDFLSDDEDEEVDFSESDEESFEQMVTVSGAGVNRPTSPEKNSFMAAGRKTDFSFVSRGRGFGVYKMNGDEVSYQKSVDGLQDKNGHTIDPESMMVHDEDEKLLMLNKRDKNSVYQMDIETGHMVSEFQTDGMTAKALIPITHNAQSTPQKDFRLLSGAGFLRIDPRIAGGVVQNEVFQWSGATSKFECAATTADGDLVIGSRLGKINLYSRERFAGGGRGVGLGDRKSATTVLPGRGDPILGVDVTKDGSYVVATCQRYLLFYNTHPRGLAENAFKKPAAKAMRPPMKLSIRPTDLKKFGESNFKHAAFNYNGPETTIVASSGKNVITWSVARVLLAVITTSPLYHLTQGPSSLQRLYHRSHGGRSCRW